MVETSDAAMLAATGSIFAVVVAADIGVVGTVSAGLMVVLAVINIAPVPSGDGQRYAITGVTTVGVVSLLPWVVGDPVVLTLVGGGVLGLGVLAVKGPEFRWSAIGIVALAVLVSAGLAVLSGRLTTALTLLAMDVLGLVGARFYWQTR